MAGTTFQKVSAVVKSLAGNTNPATIPTPDHLANYLAKVEAALSAIQAITPRDVWAAQLSVPLITGTATSPRVLLKDSIFEAVGSMAAALEAQQRLLTILHKQLTQEVRS